MSATEPISVFVVDLHIDETDDEIHDFMTKMREVRTTNSYSNIVCSISGFDRDQRELWEIPEVRKLCRRLVRLGFISYLDLATSLPGCPDEELIRYAFGAFEIWYIGEGRVKTHTWAREWNQEQFEAVMEELLAVASKANQIADDAAGGA